MSLNVAGPVLKEQQLLIEQWKADSAGTYRSWFLWEERLKNFRSIRRGLNAVVTEIRGDTFGAPTGDLPSKPSCTPLPSKGKSSKAPIMRFSGSQNFAFLTFMRTADLARPHDMAAGNVVGLELDKRSISLRWSSISSRLRLCLDTELNSPSLA